MSLKNVMVAQSGGPTVAINASLAGVIRGVMASDQYETVYGSVNGILGILNNHLLNLTEIMNENPAYLDRLETTPATCTGCTAAATASGISASARRRYISTRAAWFTKKLCNSRRTSLRAVRPAGGRPFRKTGGGAESPPRRFDFCKRGRREPVV